MKRTIIIILLSLALIVLFLWDATQLVEMRAAERLVRVSGFEVWKGACVHAAAGDKARLKWCEWAEAGTRSVVDEHVSDDEFKALAVYSALRRGGLVAPDASAKEPPSR
jgi:hypothetical protein